MTGEEATLGMADALEVCDIPYILVGSFSSNFYGIGRSTKDADFVIQLEGKSLSEITEYLGPAFKLDPQMSFETLTGTTRHIVNVEGSSFEIELFYLSADLHDQSRFERRQQVKILGHLAYLPTAEDVIVTKLRWAKQGSRPKDKDDARNVIAVQAGRLDWDYIHRWCEAHGTRTLLDEIRESLPPI
ncbi:MAG: hypothetical protein QF473_01040 [Planctomycetota bacterium]|jgi:predicted nucleotidyltransferase|nr:hypothetical protein [Planctomycetota bacterium]